MEKITIVCLLEAYRQRVERGEIQFLQKNSEDCGDVLQLIKPLLARIKEAEGKPKGLSFNLDWNKTHESGRELWEKLVGCALHDIDRVAKGNSKLFNFAKAAASFEDLLYGMDERYRDHTLHSLWVYLLGEHILRDYIPDIYESLDWYLHNDLLKDSSYYSPKLLRESKTREKELLEKTNKRKDASWCLIALCHDLGYSLSRLHDLNKSVEKVIDYLDIPGFSRIGYSFEIEHQYLGSSFLELMADELFIVASTDNKDIVTKNFRESGSYWRLCRALEKRQHGIYSSFVIYKLLDIFAETWVRDPAEPYGLDDGEAVDNLILGSILFAIAQHAFEFAHLTNIGSLADILVLVDELEEFSRFGRQLQARQYQDTMADVSVAFPSHKNGNTRNFDIEITYAVAKEWSAERFFVIKAKALCQKYSLESQSQDEWDDRGLVRNAVNSIKMIVEKDASRFTFYLCRDPKKTKGQLPKSKTGGYEAGEYHLECYDDEIKILPTKGKKLTLDEWFGLPKSNNI